LICEESKNRTFCFPWSKKAKDGLFTIWSNMSKSIIRVLPENLANQIAAGEVVERPASIIKELVENAIDAGARNIKIGLVNGGKRSISITDDGAGMNKDDAILAFERHATSKIKTTKDLFDIRTLGFRGEALPSIAAVSKVSLTTSTGGPGNGRKLRLEGGTLREVKEASHPKGTSLIIQQLFFNTPARRKFLKTDKTELAHISGTAIRHALSRPDISFHVDHNGRRLIQTPSHSNLLPRIMDLFGRDLVRDLLPVQTERGGMRLEGFVCKPYYHRATRDSIYFYVNHRYVRDRMISHAVMEAYRGLLPRERAPMIFLFLSLPSSEVDVNVHPSKTEVRFPRHHEVHSFITDSIHQGLMSGKGKDAPESPPAGSDDRTMGYGQVRDPSKAIPGPLPFSSIPCQGSRSFFSDEGPMAPISHQGPERPDRATPWSEPVVSSIPPTLLNASSIGYSDFLPLGQIDNTFIVLQGKRGMILVDQHTAHERILYERFLEGWGQKSMKAQRLLFPVTLELTKEEICRVEPLFKELGPLGFELECFGGNSILVRSVPSLLAGKDIGLLLRDVCDRAVSFGRGTSLEELAHDIIAVMACHAAVRAGKELKREEIHSLIGDLKTTNRPYTCPHGRPIALFFEMRHIKKFFLR